MVAYGGQGIDIFDIAARRRLRTIDLAPNQGPHGLVWLADGRLLATTERSRSLTVVDTRRGDAVTAIPTAQDGTHMVAVAPGGRLAFTANIASGTVSVIDLAAGRKIRDVAVGGAPEGIAIASDGRTLWVADLAGARVQGFDAALLAAADASGFRPALDIAVTVEGAGAEEVATSVADPLERELRKLRDLGDIVSLVRPGGVTIQAKARGPAFDKAAAEAALARAGAAFPKGRTEAALAVLTVAPLAVEPTGERPIRVVVTPDGGSVIVSNAGSGTLTILDTRSRAAPRTVAVGGAGAVQVTILLSPDGRRLYAAETGRDRVAEIDLASGTVLRRLPAGRQGDGLAIAP